MPCDWRTARWASTCGCRRRAVDRRWC
jgi:hypothetical protein